MVNFCLLFLCCLTAMLTFFSLPYSDLNVVLKFVCFRSLIAIMNVFNFYFRCLTALVTVFFVLVA